MFRSFKRKDLALQMTSSGLGIVGALVGVCVNSIVLAVSRLGVTLHALTMKKNYSKNVETCQLSESVEH